MEALRIIESTCRPSIDEAAAARHHILLALLLLRRPHYAASGRVWAAVDTGRVGGMVAAHSVTTIFYLLRKELGNVRAGQTIARILQIFKVAGIDEPGISQTRPFTEPARTTSS